MHAPFLQPNDEIRILSTARKISEEELTPFKNYLEAEGYKVTYAKNLFREEHQFAGKDEERFADLQEAINDPEVKVIWMARGGYGSHRIIEALDVEHLKEDPKWIIGYSDVTVIHSFLQRRHIESVHGPMPVNFDPEDTEPFDACLDLLAGLAEHEVWQVRAATETTLFTYDKELLRDLQVVGAVMEPIRVMAANRLAENGSQWMNVFKEFNR